MKDQEHKSQSCVVGGVGSHNREQINSSVSDTRWNVLFLHFLKVELRVAVEPVRNLNDEEEFEHESHRHIRIVLPQSRKIEEKTFTEDYISTPQDGHSVENKQLSRLVELALLYLRQVELCLYFLYSKKRANE